MSDLVLVTGASGYIAGHCVRELLEHGYRVRGTVRDASAEHRVAHLREIADRTGGSLEFVSATLDDDRGWAEAVRGCKYVLHVASPVPPGPPKHPDELVRPAVDGTLRVLRACAESGTVKRVVFTSSTAAVVYNRARDFERTRTEADWSDPDVCDAYQKSKTLAERAAWEFVAGLPAARRFELTAVNPGLVLGPILHGSSGTSLEVIRKLLSRDVPAAIPVGFATVDVRDVAVAHRLAMELPQAAGNRYLLAGPHVPMRDMARMLAAEFNPRGWRVPTGVLPRWLMWVVARFDRTVRLALVFVGVHENVSSAKAERELGWSMRPVRQSILDTARSLIVHGVVRSKEHPGFSSRGGEKHILRDQIG